MENELQIQMENELQIQMENELQTQMENKLQIQWDNARSLRNRLLLESDYLVACAYEQGNPVSSELKAYRQALRDLPETFSDPAEIVWPTLNLVTN